MSRNDMWKLADEIDFSQRAINTLADDLAASRRRSDWPVRICISGAQTGADQAFLRAAKACGYKTGGMIPKGALTEDGPRPDLIAEFNLVESEMASYPPRTKWNIKSSDGTLIFTFGGHELDGGSRMTADYARTHGRLYLPIQVIPGTKLHCIPDILTIRQWIVQMGIRTLNGAGNRESKSPGIGVAVETLCLEILRKP